MKRKLLIIGVDGADPEDLKYGLEKGKLPLFKKLISNGNFERLKSTIPPASISGWYSIVTGQNPGKTGQFDYLKKVKGEYRTELKFIGDLLSLTPFWQILNKHKIKVGIINVPYTFPPIPINEFMVCIGERAHIKKGQNCCYPPGLEKEIDRTLGPLKYCPHYAYFNQPEEEKYKECEECLKNFGKLHKFLIDKHGKSIELLMVFMSVDTFNHFIVNKDKKLSFFKEIEEEMNSIIKLYKPNDILVISDHGGGPTKKEFYVNEFLIKNKFLKLKSKKGGIMRKMGINLENAQKVLSFFKIDSKLVSLLPRDFLENVVRKNIPSKKIGIREAEIDWKKTKAFSFYDSGGGIFINLKGREKEGIVEEKDYGSVVKKIILKLKELKDPDTKEKLKVEAFSKKEVYSGKYSEWAAPDIPYVIEEWAYVPKTALVGEVFKKPRDPGNHKYYGIFVSNGKNVKKEKLNNPEVIDIAPTVLKYFGIKKPANMDGAALDVFK